VYPCNICLTTPPGAYVDGEPDTSDEEYAMAMAKELVTSDDDTNPQGQAITSDDDMEVVAKGGKSKGAYSQWRADCLNKDKGGKGGKGKGIQSKGKGKGGKGKPWIRTSKTRGGRCAQEKRILLSGSPECAAALGNFYRRETTSKDSQILIAAFGAAQLDEFALQRDVKR
jgi:hypothetical protein